MKCNDRLGGFRDPQMQTTKYPFEQRRRQSENQKSDGCKEMARDGFDN